MRNIRLLFVYPNAVLQNPPPVSLATFYSLLKSKNIEIKMFDTTLYDVEDKTSDKTKEEHLQVKPFNFEERGIKTKSSDIYEDFREIVFDFGPDIIALSFTEVTYPLGISLLERIREHQCIKLVGGVFPTFAPEVLLKNELVDIACIGEGEGAIVDLIEALLNNKNISNIKNLWIKHNNRIIRNPLRELVDLNRIPFPDYDIFEEERYYRPMAGKMWKLFPIETSRGCPYNCTYCNSPGQKRLYKSYGMGKFLRHKSTERIDRELNYIINKYSVEYIYFLSDTLLSFPDREFNKFCQVYKKYNLPFWCQNRPEAITYERAKRLKDIGCHRMSIGVEHGNEDFRKAVLKKQVSNKKIFEAFEILDKLDIPVTVNNIIGFPGETRELAFETIRLNRRLKWDTTNAYAFTPFQGTELYDICLKKGCIDSNTSLKYLTKGSVLDMPQFPKEEIDGLIKTFVLYSKMPEEYFDKIKIAEQNTDEGDRTFRELSVLLERMRL